MANLWHAQVELTAGLMIEANSEVITSCTASPQYLESKNSSQSLKNTSRKACSVAIKEITKQKLKKVQTIIAITIISFVFQIINKLNTMATELINICCIKYIIYFNLRHEKEELTIKYFLSRKVCSLFSQIPGLIQKMIDVLSVLSARWNCEIWPLKI